LTHVALAPAPHWVRFAAQVVAHTPLEQICPGPQELPQLPQFARSLIRFTQPAAGPTPHVVRLAPHVEAHWPAEQT